MKAKDRIRQELKTIMSADEANACQIFRSWHYSTNQIGWDIQRFEEIQVWFVGENLQEALDTIKAHKSAREDCSKENQMDLEPCWVCKGNGYVTPENGEYEECFFCEGAGELSPAAMRAKEEELEWETVPVQSR